MKLTKAQARHFLLTHQNLLLPRSLDGKEGILEYIRKVGCIQFDPLDVVGYNPNLVLQSRIRDFKPELLEELLYSDRQLIDEWDKNMSIFPPEDWPYFRRYRERAFEKYGNQAINEILPQIRESLEKEGPLSSKDFNFDFKVDWPWAPTRAARAALESMYFWGELIIHHKSGTRKFYDFTRRHISNELITMKDPNTTMNKYFQWHVKRRIGAVGLLWGRASDAWLGIKWMKSKDRNQAIINLEKVREILSIEIEDVSYPFYIRKEEENLLGEVINEARIFPKTSFIAPLDNFLWDRKLINELFEFEYTWEVYKPVAQRKYGYYVLPVLYGDKFIARIEPKYDKKTKKLQILNWWWEPKVVVDQDMIHSLSQCFKEFISYLNADGIEYDKRNKRLSWLGELDLE